MRNDKFRDPIHGFIEVREHEKRIVDSAPFQRLRNIKQLALTSYVYHGAEHTRFGHSLGVMHLATRAFRSALSKGQYQFREDREENERYVSWLEQILRLIALTHDLGHAPFSHAAEDLFPVKEVLTNGKEKRYKHEDLTEYIIKSNPISNIIKDIGQEYILKYGSDEYNITPEMISDIYIGRSPGRNLEFTFLKTFMDSELDCDKMDYLLRDSLYCGVSYGKFDLERLIASMVVTKRPEMEQTPFLCIDSGGVNVFEEFVLARYFMFVQVYFHRTRRYFDLTLSEALRKCLPDGAFPINVEQYLQWDDSKVLNLLKEKSQLFNEAKCIIDRHCWTCVYKTKTHPRGDGFTLFDTAKNILCKKFGKDVFESKFLIDRSADKLPHKIVPQKYSIDHEEVIAIVDKQGFTTISDESHIINSLTEKINIQRIYAHEEVSEEALTELELIR